MSNTLPVQREEIVWDVDWDELGPLSTVEIGVQEEPLGSSIEHPKPAAQIVPVQEQAASSETKQYVPAEKDQHSPPPLTVAPPHSVQAPVFLDPSQSSKADSHVVKDLVRGERFDLGPIFAQKPQISIELISSNPAAVKLICLGLDAAEIVAGTAYCVGPRQPDSPCGGITHAVRRDGGQEILVRVSILPTGIKRLEVSVVAADSGANLGNTVEGIRLRAGDCVVAESRHLDPACASSSCATLVEIYERQGTWRMRVIGEVLARSVNELLAKHGAKTS